MRIGFAILACLLLASCATGGPDTYKLDRTLYMYASAIRWGEFEAAVEFLDPEVREEKTPTALQLQRYGQVQITGYNVQGKAQPNADELRQNVEIRLVNRHTQVERAVIDRQHWRWDAGEKRWWLVSGLPDVSPR
jgi:hypothetical protein